MNHKKLVAFIFFIFLCFWGTSVWADEEMQPESGYAAENYVEGTVAEMDMEDTVAENYEGLESDLLLNSNKSWQQGFDLRLHLGMGATIAGTTDEEDATEAMFVGYIAGDIGYRWKNGGIYLKLGYAPFDGNKFFNSKGDSTTFAFVETALLGKFYIPLVDDWELVLDAGMGLFSQFFFNLQTGIGANWHLWDMTLGFEVIYQYNILFIGQLGLHMIHASFVIGYTF